MALELKKVETHRDLKRFIDFQFRLYKGNTYWCPPLRMDEIKTLRKDKNPAFAHCEAEYWIAYRDNKPVGRIAGLINHKANQHWKEKLVRFGWIDFVDDPEVSQALIEVVAEWGKERGMTGIHGPLGFSDLDNEGMLIEGFDQLAIMTSIYNHAYYPLHMEQMGFIRAADWVQYEFDVPQISEKFKKTKSLVEQRYNVRVVKTKKKKELLPYARKMFRMLNVAFDELYGFAALTEEQMEAYTRQYFGFIRPEFISFVVDQHDDIVGFGISLPNLTYAMQKSNGRLFPLGWYYLLRAMKKNDVIDMYLLGVHPDYHGKGIAALFFYELHKAFIDFGIKKTISSPQLEDNSKALSIWKNFPGRKNVRRRVWVKHF
ncbi:MAG: GNAT family N-acetyltransferase [Bacteroidia bacterium]|nr:GNAT family N-acetyltransferase [Bacteroidia bacterium]